PKEITLKDLEIDENQVKKTILRIKKAKEEKQKVIVYGDYDADGISSTAILWETLYGLGIDVVPYIPDRFSEGYGLNSESIKKLKKEHPDLKLIVTVDNGIVANKQIDHANKLGIDVIVTDHHLPSEILPNAYSIIHTTKTSGAGISWIISREILKEFKKDSWEDEIDKKLDIATVGIVADQMPMIDINRSFVKHGLLSLQQTTRPGLRCLYELATINAKDISTYHINYIIAPRINAMGRIKHGLDSLRFLCTKDFNRAQELTRLVGRTNEDRQKIVDEVIITARSKANEFSKASVIVVADATYHEGVIGLAAARLVEEFYKPTIVFSLGEKYAKASARSINGLNIIDAVRKLDDLWIEGGGHSMAAGFTILSSKVDEFTKRINEVTKDLLTKDMFEKKILVDLEIDLDSINWEVLDNLKKFEPFGVGNAAPVFATFGVSILESRAIGNGTKHLKMKLKQGKVFDAIAFGWGDKIADLKTGKDINVSYNLEINEWNGNKSIQLKIKDISYVE
ncbi:single-stranded-DNA-specific exonuclease RecJ, partial [Candidatus Microgenomates bacterium]|nr:single-stranded-DNA-specific exonuclease RecJ [Candidatus Microgenomates bacterium]